MDRRGFLKVFAAVTAATAFPSPVQALPSVDPTKRYRDCLEIVDRCRAETTSRGAGAQFDELCRYVRNNFPAPNPAQLESNIAVVKRIVFHDEFDENELRQVPPLVLDDVYIISLAKLLIHHYKAPIDPGHSEEFTWFHDTYARLIIRCFD